MGMYFAIFIIAIVVVIIVKINSAVSQEKARQLGQQHIAERQLQSLESQQRRNAEQAIDQFSAQNDLRILTESLDILESTKDISIALRRITMIKDCALRLEDYQRRNVIRVPSSMLEYADMSPQAEADFIRNAISKVYEKVLTAALMLKTDKGRRNRMAAFFDKMHEHADSIPESLYPWINNKMADAGIEYTFESITDASPISK